MKPIRIGKPYTAMIHGKPITRHYVWFRDGSRELMNLPRLAWTLAYGRPRTDMVVYPRNGDASDVRRSNLVCVPRKERLRRLNAKRTAAAKAFTRHKPYPLAGLK